jgi:hypothetical protein
VTAFCVRCKAKRPVILIRGKNLARDQLECEMCGRRWNTGNGRPGTGHP